MPVALLTGRVYQDGLGGLRAVLFISAKLSSTSPNQHSDKRSLAPTDWNERSLQVRAHDINESVGRKSLLGTDLLLRVDDVKADVALKQFRHQHIHGAACGHD